MSSSQKLKNITSIRNAIMALINDNQGIKRLVCYTTPTPLALQGYDLNGNLVEQPDLDVDLVNVEKRILPFFSNEILSEDKVFIVCRRQDCDLKDNVLGENHVVIDVICPVSYSPLDLNEDRESSIGCIICDLVDQEVIQSLGKIRTVYAKDSTLNEQKNFNVFSLFLEIPTSNAKVW